MTEYDNRGQVALWKPNSDNPQAPSYKGTAIAHRDIREGETIEVALWDNESSNPNAPLLKGKISDKRTVDTVQRRPEPPQQADDPIPF